nr:immunoglobulin light chain junction region [Macaca mulatta]
ADYYCLWGSSSDHWVF